MLILRRIWICLFLFFIALPAKAEEGWYSFELAEITLSGRVIYQDFFGPPNYGEDIRTDLVETAVILVLYEPINVKGNPDEIWNSETVINIQRVQLVVPWEKIYTDDLSGFNVTVQGKLFARHTAHHRTEVLMSVNEIVIHDKPEWSPP